MLSEQDLRTLASPVSTMLPKAANGEKVKGPGSKAAKRLERQVERGRKDVYVPTKLDVIQARGESRFPVGGRQANPTAPERRWDRSDKHHINSTGNVSPAPPRGKEQLALDRSVPHPTDDSARLGYVDGKIIEFKYTGHKAEGDGFFEGYHGYVLAENKMKRKVVELLKENGWVDSSGRVIIEN